MTDDSVLLRAWQAGDRDAGAELFERHYDALARFFFNKVSAGASADLVQSTFLACVEAADRYRGEGSFKSFLFGIAHNLLREHYRRRRSDDPVDDDRAGPSPSPSLLVGAKDEQRLLLAGLRALPAELQVVLELFYWEDMTAAEIGGAIGIPEGTAKSRLRRGREELDKQLRRLATSDQLLASTLTRLDDWAQDLRQRIEVPEG